MVWSRPPTLCERENVRQALLGSSGGVGQHHRCRTAVPSLATYYAAPLLIAQRRGLIVNISFYGNAKVHDPAYYASKAGLDKLAAVYAEHFTPFNVAAISLWPGYVATECMTQLMETDQGVKQLREKMGFEEHRIERPRYPGSL